MAALVLITGAALLCFKILYPEKYKEEVNEYAAQYGFSPALIFAVIRTESDFDAAAVSRAGAAGLMQLMPATAAFTAGKIGMAGFEISGLYNPAINIRLGCAYLRYLADKFADMRLALYAYNAGEGNVAAWLINPDYSRDGKTLYKIPFKETRQYYKRVASAERIYKLIK